MHCLIVDVSFMLRRAQHVEELHDMGTSTGIPTGGLMSLCTSIVDSCNSFSCDNIVLCFDHGHSKRRMEVYDQYKVKNYDEEERDQFGMTSYEWFKHQVQLTKKMCELYGIKVIDIVGKEADDNVYQVCKMLNCQKTLITEDKDYYAFVDEQTSVYRPIRKEYVTLENFYRMTGCKTPKHFLLLKCMQGDGSDGIPGCMSGVAGGTYSKIVDLIGEQEINVVNDATIEYYTQEVANQKGGYRAKRILNNAAEFFKNLHRNMNLIDVTKEEYDFFQLGTIRQELCKSKEINMMEVMEFLRGVEFSPARSVNLHNTLSRFNGSLEDYMREVKA